MINNFNCNILAIIVAIVKRNYIRKQHFYFISIQKQIGDNVKNTKYILNDGNIYYVLPKDK